MASDGVEIIQDLRIPIEGGLSLGANLYKPIEGGALPTVLVALPYLKDAIAGVENGWALEQFAKAGFNALLIDLQGCGTSEGIARRPFDGADVQDALAAINWATQQSWCDGRIGFWGASYGGIMALRAAATNHDALKAIVAIECASDANTQFVRPNGVPGNISPMGLWPTGDLAMQFLPPLFRDDAENWRRIWQDRLQHIRPRLLDYLQRSGDDPAWQIDKIDIEQIQVPTLVVGGWRDFFCAPSIDIYQRLQCKKNLIVGPWSHMMPDMAPLAPINLTHIAIDWWRRWLLNDEVAPKLCNPVTAYVEEKDEWHGFDTWPPLGHTHTLFNDVALDKPICKPVNPTVGYKDGLWGLPLPSVPFDSTEDDQSGISFTSEPLLTPMVIAGAPNVHVQLSEQSIGVEWLSAKLSIIDVDGKARLATSGSALVNETGETSIKLTDTCIEVKEAQRLRLTLSAADFPRHWPQTGAQLLAISQPPMLELVSADILQQPVITLPVHEPGINFVPLARSMMPEWSIAEDLITGTVTLALGQDASSFIMGKGATLSMKNRVTSAASRLITALNKVEGKVTATVETDGQPTIKAEGHIIVSASFAQASAMVYEGDKLLLEKSWQLDLTQIGHKA